MSGTERPEFDYSSHYDMWGNGCDDGAIWTAGRYIRQLQSWLPASPSGKILEIGAGNGYTTQRLAAAGYHVEAIEADQELARRLIEKKLKISWVPAADTISYLQSKAGEFDLICAHHVIEHVPVNQQIDFMRGVANALRDNGYFVCETPNALSSAASWHRYADWTHTSIFTEHSLEFLFGAANLTVQYVGKPREEPMHSTATSLRAKNERLVRAILLPISRLIRRTHLVAEFGKPGLYATITPYLLGVAKKDPAAPAATAKRRGDARSP